MKQESRRTASAITWTGTPEDIRELFEAAVNLGGAATGCEIHLSEGKRVLTFESIDEFSKQTDLKLIQKSSRITLATDPQSAISVYLVIERHGASAPFPGGAIEVSISGTNDVTVAGAEKVMQEKLDEHTRSIFLWHGFWVVIALVVLGVLLTSLMLAGFIEPFGDWLISPEKEKFLFGSIAFPFLMAGVTAIVVPIREITAPDQQTRLRRWGFVLVVAAWGVFLALLGKDSIL